ncbi:MAG: hypothetical protein HDQ98_00485 [Lachnospiraceae bacterium]|nr:hypothetical protein [Lachnospiraceae bacterium]
MRDYRIEIEPFEFVALQKLRMSRGINVHAVAEITMLIKDENREQYLGILSKETWVKIMGISEQAEGGESVYTVLFHGQVTDFSLIQGGNGTVLSLELMSGTSRMDLKTHFRVFQNKDTESGLIHRQLTESYPEGKASGTEGMDDKTGGVLIQYRETDWEFLRRLAGRSGHYLVADALKKGVRYEIGLPAGVKREVESDRLRIALDLNEYMEKFQNGMPSLQSSDMLELKLEEREIYQLGDNISYQGKDYFIYKIMTEYKDAECIHEYSLRTKAALKVLPVLHNDVTGSSFDATITNVKNDRVQVEIAQDEWKAVDGQKWFLYSTVYSSPDGTGWYCMPEIGDSVRLYVPDKEENCFISSAVHKESDGSRQNPDHKSFKTKYGKELLFTPDSIRMTNNQGMMVEMDDSKGITITSDRNITIQAQDNLTIASENASLLLAASDSLQVKQGGTSIKLSGDISFTGGEFRIQ